MNYIFDLENTLVHTKEAVRAAYVAAGVDLPEDFFVMPWPSFCSAEEHNRKNEIYHHFAYKIRILPAFNLWRATPGAVILSGISEAALGVVRDTVPELQQARIHYGMHRKQKIDFVAHLKGGGLYVDDDVQACLAVSQLGGWQVMIAGAG